MASRFSDAGGVRTLLNLTEDTTFAGFLPLANLLIRHAMEDRACLRFAMEKVNFVVVAEDDFAMYS